MCVAIPGKVDELLGNGFAVVDFLGVRKKVAVDMIDGISVGEFVIVHAGFAIARLNEEAARETVSYLRSLC